MPKADEPSDRSYMPTYLDAEGHRLGLVMSAAPRALEVYMVLCHFRAMSTAGWRGSTRRIASAVKELSGRQMRRGAIEETLGLLVDLGVITIERSGKQERHITITKPDHKAIDRGGYGRSHSQSGTARVDTAVAKVDTAVATSGYGGSQSGYGRSHSLHIDQILRSDLGEQPTLGGRAAPLPGGRPSGCTLPDSETPLTILGEHPGCGDGRWTVRQWWAAEHAWRERQEATRGECTGD